MLQSLGTLLVHCCTKYEQTRQESYWNECMFVVLYTPTKWPYQVQHWVISTHSVFSPKLLWGHSRATTRQEHSRRGATIMRNPWYSRLKWAFLKIALPIRDDTTIFMGESILEIDLVWYDPDNYESTAQLMGSKYRSDGIKLQCQA